MKTLIILLVSLLLSIFSSNAQAKASLKTNFKIGDPEITSIHKITFGPEGILFVGDSNAAQIVAVDLSKHPMQETSKIQLNQLDKLIADMMGTSLDQVQIVDMAVNPENNNIYLAIRHNLYRKP